MTRRTVSLMVAAGLVIPLLSCGSDDNAGPSTTEPTTGSSAPVEGPVPTTEPASVTTTPPQQPALRDELLAMMEADQAERTAEVPESGELPPSKDEERTARLAAIIDEFGWPTFDLVGKDGSTAAWVIAQHADLDPAFQERVIGLMGPLVEAGQADASELAYLSDRIAMNAGEPQVYGTQVSCEGGEPAPATPLVDEANVDALREAVGMGTLDEYYEELGQMCSEEAGG